MSGSASDTEAAEALLRTIGAGPGRPFDIAEAALALSALARPGIDLAPYRRHLAALAADLAAADPPSSGMSEEALHRQAAALNAVLVDRHGYRGDRVTYDDLDNADLTRVIDRRHGLPVALGVLWLHTARSQGWTIAGLAFPGHFLLRLGAGPCCTILDPFDGGRIHDAASLRRMLKSTIGPDAELQPAHYAVVDDRDVLLRLENNVKLRLIREGRLREAAEVLERMLLFAPDRTPLWRETGLVHARLGNLRRATAALQTFLESTSRPEERRQVEQILKDLSGRMN